MPKIPLTADVLEHLADRFKVLAEPNRLAILAELRRGEATVSELVLATGLGQANVSKHLNLLHRFGFVQRRKEGLNVHYELTDEDVFRICDLMCGRLEQEARGMSGLIAGRPARRKRRSA